jgi:hypothetical protein
MIFLFPFQNIIQSRTCSLSSDVNEVVNSVTSQFVALISAGNVRREIYRSVITDLGNQAKNSGKLFITISWDRREEFAQRIYGSVLILGKLTNII